MGNVDKLFIAINKHISDLVRTSSMWDTNLFCEQNLIQILRECSYNFAIFEPYQVSNLDAVYKTLAKKYIMEKTFDESNINLLNVRPEHKDMYIKILKLFANYGMDVLNDCRASSRSKHRSSVYLFNLFMAGLANIETGNEKAANIIFAQIKHNLKTLI